MGRHARRAQRLARLLRGALPTACRRSRNRSVIYSAIIPQPLAKLPWRLIFLVAGIAGIGLMTLYSAAGGSIRPWALKQGITFLFFLASRS